MASERETRRLGAGHYFIDHKVGARTRQTCANCGCDGRSEWAEQECPNPGEWDHGVDEEVSDAP